MTFLYVPTSPTVFLVFVCIAFDLVSLGQLLVVWQISVLLVPFVVIYVDFACSLFVLCSVLDPLPFF